MSDTEDQDGATPAKVQRLSSSVTEISSEADNSMIDMETQKALEDIDACQNEIDSLNEKASEEILLIEQKYNKLRKPHFEQRNELIKQIPNFWVTVFINHPQMSHLISQEEERCFQYLTQVEVSEFEDIKSGYSLAFHFSKNPYFSNEVISKNYFLLTSDDRPNCKSSDIKWKNGKDLSKTFQSRRVQSRVAGVGPNVGSFFSWFAEKGNPLSDKIADVLKDDIWPNPLQYYLAPDIEVEENGQTDNESDDDSVVIVGDDDSEEDDDLEDDDDVYEVDEFDDTGMGEGADESVELLELDDDDDDDVDDDDVEVIESDSDLDDTGLADTTHDEGMEPAETTQDGNDESIEAHKESLNNTDTMDTLDKSKTRESSGKGDGESKDNESNVKPDADEQTKDNNKEGSVNDGGTSLVSETVKDGDREDRENNSGITSTSQEETGGGDG